MIEEIEIGAKYEDMLGKAKYSKNGVLIKNVRLKREVFITNKTSNSIEYKDDGNYISWISIDDFLRVENSVKSIRFIKSV